MRRDAVDDTLYPRFHLCPAGANCNPPRASLCASHRLPRRLARARGGEEAGNVSRGAFVSRVDLAFVFARVKEKARVMNFIRRLASNQTSRTDVAEASTSTSRERVDDSSVGDAGDAREDVPRVVNAMFHEGRDSELVFLWDVAAGVAAGEDDARRDALNAFFGAFADVYAGWKPRCDESRDETDIGCARAHPHAVIYAAVEDATRLPARVERSLSGTLDAASLDERLKQLGLESFQALEIMARSPHNRVSMEQCNASRALASACKTCSQRALALSATLSSARNDDEIIALFRYLQRVITCAVGAIESFLGDRWALRSLNENGVLLALIDVLRVQKTVIVRVHGNERDIARENELRAMSAIGRIMDVDAMIQKSLIAAGGVDVFFEGLVALENGEGLMDAGSFESSLRTIDVARRLFRGNKVNIERAQEIGMFKQLARLIRVAGKFSQIDESGDTKDESMTYVAGVPWSKDVFDSCLLQPRALVVDERTRELFARLLSMLQEDSHGDGGWSTQGANELLTKCLIDSVFDACSNSSESSESDAERLHIRAIVMDFLGRAMNPTVLRAMGRARLWELLFDDDTFGPIPNTNDKETDDGESDVAELKSRLQTQTTALLLRACRIASDAGDCTHVCNVLVSVITSRAMQPAVSIRFCRALELLITNSTHSVCKALAEVEAPGRLAGGLHAQLKCWGCGEVTFIDQPTSRASSAALGSSLSAMTTCLNVSDELAVSALNNDGIADVILNHLLWCDGTRDLAISAVGSLVGLCSHSPHTTAAHRDAWSTLVRRFIQTLPKARGTSNALVVSMLSGLRAMLNNSNGSGHRLREWISSEDGAEFVQIVALCDGDAGEDIALEVILTIQVIISGSRASASVFERAVGYETLIDAIQSARGSDVISRQLYDALVNFIVDGTVDAHRGFVDVSLRNSDALKMMLTLFNKFGAIDTLKDELIQLLRTTLTSSVTSRATANAADVMDFLLEWYMDADRRQTVLEVIALCSSFSISTRHVRHMFKLLQTDEVSEDDKLGLVRMLTNAALHDGPSTFFDFGGPGCGIHIDKQMNLSARTGYSISMWFRVEKFPSSGGPVPLFSLLSAAGNGVLAELRANRLTLGIRGTEGTEDVVSIETDTAENEWKLLTVVHSSGRMSRPSVRVFFGPNAVCQAKLQYPTKSNETISHCRIASVTLDASLEDQNATMSPFFGQVGTIHVFEDAMPENGVAMIHALGPEYAGVFNYTESHTEQIVSTVNVNVVEVREMREHLAEHRTVSVSAINYIGRVAQTDARSTSRFEYALMGGAKVCATKSVKDIIHCLGGVQVVLPIFSVVIGVSTNKKEFVRAGVDLLVALLDGSRFNQVTLKSCEGYALVASLLREDALGALSPELLPALDRLRRASGVENESVSVGLVLDLHLWSLADDETQSAHAKYLHSLASGHADGLRYHLSLSEMIDALDLSPGTNGRSRRRALLGVLKALMISAQYQVVEQTTESIVHVIEECADEETVGSILRWLVECMQPGEALQPALYQAFNKLGGPLLALSPLSRSTSAVRSSALLWLANLMPPLDAPKNAMSSSNISTAFGAAAGALAATLGGKFTAAASQDFEVGFFTAVANALEKYPLDIIDSRSALFELLLGGQALPAETVAAKMKLDRTSSVRAAAGRLFAKVTRSTPESQQKERESESGISVPGIVNAGAAGVLLRLMNADDSSEMRISVLELLLQLVEGAGVNAQAVLEQRGWQTWILPILRESDGESRREEMSMARRLITALLAHAVLKTNEGYLHVSNTLGVVDILIKRGVLADESDLAQELLSDLLAVILPPRSANEHDEWSEVQNIESPTCRHNLAQLLNIFDSIVSDTASTAAMLGVPTASGDAFNFGDVSWRFYDHLWNLLDAITPSGQSTENISEIKDAAKNVNVAKKLHRRAKSMMRDLPFAGTVAHDVDSVESAEALRETCQRLGFRLSMLYVRAAPMESLQRAANVCTGLFPSFLSPVLLDQNGKELDTSTLRSRAHLFIADLLRYAETFKADNAERVAIVMNLVRLSSEVGRLLLTDSDNVEESAHLDGRDLISEQMVAEAAANEAKESRKVKELRAKVSETFLAERTRHEQRQTQAEAALLETRKLKLSPVCERERARRAMYRLTFEERCDVLARRWSKVLRGLQSERGAWSSESSEKYHRWKLDLSEDASMRRPRLQRNYEFVEYPDNQKGESSGQSEVQDIQPVRLAGMGQKWKLKLDKDFVDVDDTTEELVEKLAMDKEDAMHNQSKVVFSTPATLVTFTRTVPGKLNISRDAIVFAADRTAETTKERTEHFWRWSVHDVIEVHHMRYRLQHKAFEMHCFDHTSAFFAFDSKKSARYAATRVVSATGATLMNRRAKADAAQRAKELWRKRELSTFDYLMALNMYAGRTLHDLSQYPIFPWVLREYDAETIDLDDPSVFRDLGKPVGALNEERLKQFVERYESLADDPDTPPFHYGSHYSSSPIVLFFLLRMEPYTKLARALQGDRFDRADRLFHSIAETYAACNESSADVKELIPEFYYSSEFLANSNSLKLGKRQDGHAIDDVVLPPWAKGSRHEFTRVMRAALESDHVSANLHKWIDLIFGHAQRGQTAVDRFNVFYYLTYEGAVDMDALEDEEQRNAIETQIVNFGQTPTQIFRHAHPPRMRRHPTDTVVSLSPESLKLASDVGAGSRTPQALGTQSVVGVSVFGSRAMIMNGGRDISAYRIHPAHEKQAGGDEAKFAYTLESEASLRLAGEFDVGVDSLALAQSLDFALHGKVLLSVGHWDRSMRLYDIEERREIQCVSTHRDVTTCVAVCEWTGYRTWDEYGKQTRQVVVVTGSRDTTLAIWELKFPQSGWRFSKGARGFEVEPKMICFGHDEAVTCVAVSASLGLIASGSADGTLILHDIRDGRIVRALERTPRGFVPSSIAFLSKSSLVVCACNVAGALSVHDVNGATLAKIANRHEAFDTVCVTRDERHVLIGNRRGDITARASHDLSVRAQINVSNVGVASIQTVGRDECLLVGLLDGRLCLWSPTLA